jgi:hypothetical protein
MRAAAGRSRTGGRGKCFEHRPHSQPADALPEKSAERRPPHVVQRRGTGARRCTPVPNSTSPRDWQRDWQAHDTKSSPAHSPKMADRCRCKDIEKPGHPCHIKSSLHGTVCDQNVSSGPTVAGTRVTQSRGSTRNAQSSVPPYRSREKERGWLNGEMQKSTGE